MQPIAVGQWTIAEVDTGSVGVGLEVDILTCVYHSEGKLKWKEIRENCAISPFKCIRYVSCKNKNMLFSQHLCSTNGRNRILPFCVTN